MAQPLNTAPFPPAEPTTVVVGKKNRTATSPGSEPPLSPQEPGLPSIPQQSGYAILNENFPPMPVNQVQEFRLPSGGIPYAKGGKQLLPGGLVYIRQMTGLEELIVNSQTLNDQAKIARVVASCTTFPKTGVTHKHLTATDRLILLFAIRRFSFGSEYRLSSICPNCEAKFEASIDLGNMNVEEMPRVEKDAQGNVVRTYTFDPDEGIACTLSNGAELRLRILTGEDEDFVIGEIKKGTGSKFVPPLIFNYGIDVGTFLRSLLAIAKYQPSPGANLIPFDYRNPAQMQTVANMYLGLPAKDTILIDHVYGKHDVGIDNFVTVPCKACSEEVRVPIVLTPGFLRPTDG